ncbi:MAG: DUF4230 domain-containing protein [Bacteroidales bacterium]|nr:DUF4230 domain-containing protein [Bacteroidales bacterium]
MKVKFYEAMVVVILSLMLASCQGGDVELKSIHIEALKQIRFYHYRVANVKAELVRENNFVDDKLVGFYDGHVDFGINFDDRFKSRVYGDSLVVIDTHLEILNTEKWFIDGVPQYMEKGDITMSDRKALDEQANRMIYEKSISDGANKAAIQNLKEQITDILTRKFNFKKVEINCADATGL